MAQKIYKVSPTAFAACVELAGGPVAGGFLCQAYLKLRERGKTLADEHNKKAALLSKAMIGMKQVIKQFKINHNKENIREYGDCLLKLSKTFPLLTRGRTRGRKKRENIIPSPVKLHIVWEV